MAIPNFYSQLRHFSRSLHLRSLISTSLLKALAPFPSISPDCDQFQRTKTEQNPIKSFSSLASQTSHLLLTPRRVYGDPNVSMNPYGGFRSFSASSPNALSSIMRNSNRKRKGPKPFLVKFSEVADMIRRNESGLECELNLSKVKLTVAYVTRIFEALNSEKVSALRFFNWVRVSKPGLRRNSDICSLMIDNIGRLNDYESMTCLLNEFREEQICLTKNAFRFLPDLMLNKDSLMNSVTEAVKILKGVGGSCGATGVRSLIELFSSLGLLEMARFVMQLTEKNTSYYNIMIREKCRKQDLEGARGLLDEMRQAGCEPNTTSYNLVLSILSKIGESAEVLFKEMEDMGCSPDETTFEILVLQSCRHGHFDFALWIVDKMPSLGLEPRITTHVAIVKGYFASQRYEEANKYVIDSSLKHGQSSNVLYSLLARLYLKKDDMVNALNIISEMIENGLRPHFRVYNELLGHLRRSGRTDLARDLEIKFSRLHPQTTTETGDLSFVVPE